MVTTDKWHVLGLLHTFLTVSPSYVQNILCQTHSKGSKNRVEIQNFTVIREVLVIITDLVVLTTFGDKWTLNFANLHTMVNFFLSAERPLCRVIFLMRLIQAVLKSKTITLTVTVCIASFEAIGEFHREKLRQSSAAAFNWNGQTGGNSCKCFVTPSSSSTHSIVTGSHLYGRSRQASQWLV